MVACFVVGIAFMAIGGVEVLIPEPGQSVRDWIGDVDASSDLFLAGAWIAVFGGLFGMVALIGFYDALRDAGQVLILAPIAAAVGWTFVTSRTSSRSRWRTSSCRATWTRASRRKPRWR